MFNYGTRLFFYERLKNFYDKKVEFNSGIDQNEKTEIIKNNNAKNQT